MKAVPVAEDVGGSARGPNEVDLTPVCCACFAMDAKGLSCCLANTCFTPCTYFYSAKWLGVEETPALLTALSMCLAAEIPLCKCVSVFLGWSSRKNFKTAPLTMPSDLGDNPICRFCCEGFVVCQEVDAALQVAKKNNGEATTYGAIPNCCMFENDGKVIKAPAATRTLGTFLGELPSLGALSR
ncbi:MAG: hypothetical protein CMI16_12770 [Opitutaceae bacterium]|nr:hypothetical protein [Opitutaceae bacterium]|tara:strand:- start:1566 stop:2117 length:552 start_codon:yes stop_codon:yes gene_type:complete